MIIKVDDAQHKQLLDEMLEICRMIPNTGRYAVTLGGSFGKGLPDLHSDYDFRIYYDTRVGEEHWNLIMTELNECIKRWDEIGVKIDGIWARNISQINDALYAWLEGKGQPEDYVWCVWGYYILTDISNQLILEDPYGIAEGWKNLLSVYPASLRCHLITKHATSLRYWRNDYHYRSKVARGDTVFLYSITARLVHDIMQILYALNKVYYPGDGMNLVYTNDFTILPEGFSQRIRTILYPSSSTDLFLAQYENLMKLIDDVLNYCDLF